MLLLLLLFVAVAVAVIVNVVVVNVFVVVVVVVVNVVVVVVPAADAVVDNVVKPTYVYSIQSAVPQHLGIFGSFLLSICRYLS